MAKRKVRLELRRSPLLMKIVLLAVIVLSTVALITLSGALASTRENTEALRLQAAELEQENSRLQQYIDELGTVKGIIRIAQEELGLVEPGSIVFDPVED